MPARHTGSGLLPQRGIALVVVLWVITLLAVIATSFSVTMGTESKLARHRVDAVQARYLAEAGVFWALLGLLHRNPEMRWPTDGSVHDLVFDGATVRVSVLDERGKIDLNAAPPELLDGLLRSVLVPDRPRAQLVDAILDWRDADDLHLANGAEDPEYKAADLPYGAKDGPFETVSELMLVLGMTPDLYRQMQPALTVHSRQASVNADIAPREVLLALPGNDPDQVDVLLEERQLRTEEDDVTAITPEGRPRPAARTGTTFSVIGEALMASGAVVRRTATVRVRLGRPEPLAILEWR